MEYAKDIIYNLKYDRLVSKNKSRTGKLIRTIKENKLIILSIILLIGTCGLLYKYGLKIYKAGILNYSSSNLWKKMFKSLKD